MARNAAIRGRIEEIRCPRPPRRPRQRAPEADITVGAGNALDRAGRHDGGRQIDHRPPAGGTAAAAVSRCRYRDRGGGRNVDPRYFRDPWRAAFSRWRGAGDRAAARRRSWGAGHRRRRIHARGNPRPDRSKAISIWLKADTDIVMRRVKRRADRPLLQTDDPVATVQRLIAERDPIYRQADITIWLARCAA